MLVGKITSDNELYQYFHDGLGSITMICDSSGSYKNLYTYDDFGDFRKKDEEVSNSYCYTGQERDEEPSGLYNLRARYYAAGIGRFTQEDPIWHLSIHLNAFSNNPKTAILFGLESPSGFDGYGYNYVSNNPINYIDPIGLHKFQPWNPLGPIGYVDHLLYMLGYGSGVARGAHTAIRRYGMNDKFAHCYVSCLLVKNGGAMEDEVLLLGIIKEFGDLMRKYLRKKGEGWSWDDYTMNKVGIECAAEEGTDCWNSCAKWTFPLKK